MRFGSKVKPGFPALGSSAWRIVAVVLVNLLLVAIIGYTFWEEDWKYSQPTPRPDGLVQPELGTRISLPPALASLRQAGRPLFLHFASPKCPCTKFNLDHIRRLTQRFQNRVDFVTVIQAAETPESRQDFDKMHLAMPVVFDRNGDLGGVLGVFGTPQAALLDAEGRLYYRGNFNRSRYCVDASSEYARIALESLVSGRSLPPMPPEASITYGCPLPKRASATRSL